MSNDKNAVFEIALTFLIGATAGYVVGILFAPAGGKKNRQNIHKEINKAGEMVKDNYEKIAKEVGKGFEALKSHL